MNNPIPLPARRSLERLQDVLEGRPPVHQKAVDFLDHHASLQERCDMLDNQVKQLSIDVAVERRDNTKLRADLARTTTNYETVTVGLVELKTQLGLVGHAALTAMENAQKAMDVVGKTSSDFRAEEIGRKFGANSEIVEPEKPA